MNRITLEGSQAENLRTLRKEQTSILRRKRYDGFCIIAKEGSTLRNHSHPCSGRSVGIHADSSDELVAILSPVRCEDQLAQVVRSEAERYLAGEITAEKAAEYIQNRVSIMLAEKG